MKVIMKVSIASSNFSYAPKQIVEIDDDLATKWVNAGYCEIVEEAETDKPKRKRVDK